jgi:hypothetical protein
MGEFDMFDAKRLAIALMTGAAMFVACAPASAQTAKKYYARQVVMPSSTVVTYSWGSTTTDVGCSLAYGRRRNVSTVSCKGSDGSTAADSKCTGAKPAGATTYGATCSGTVTCQSGPLYDTSGITSESRSEFTESSTAVALAYCENLYAKSAKRVGTCTRISGSSWAAYTETTGTQSKAGATTYVCAPGPDTVL